MILKKDSSEPSDDGRSLHHVTSWWLKLSPLRHTLAEAQLPYSLVYNYHTATVVCRFKKQRVYKLWCIHWVSSCLPTFLSIFFQGPWDPLENMSSFNAPREAHWQGTSPAIGTNMCLKCFGLNGCWKHGDEWCLMKGYFVLGYTIPWVYQNKNTYFPKHPKGMRE